MRTLVLAAGMALSLMMTLSVTAVTVPQVAPVTNGEFELAVYPARLATCGAFGHDDVNIFEPGNPQGLPWLVILSPCDGSVMRAAQWSASRVTQFTDWDDDGDREARIQAITDPNHFGNPDIGVNHNMWQAYPNAQQAYVADFEELSFRLEHGAIPSSARVILSLSNFPLAQTDAVVLPYQLTCQIVFTASQMTPDADGVVHLDPTEASFTSRHASCDGSAAAFNDPGATEDEKRAVLAGLRIVQHSYWNFNHGAGDVVIDGVHIEGGRSVAEALIGV